MTLASTPLHAIVGLAVIFNLVYAFIIRSKKKQIPLPPGPRPDPLIGHLRLVPPEDHHIFFYKLGKTYGDVTYLNVLGQPMIIINSTEAAFDLMEKRSSNYSDRPYYRVLERMGFTWNLSLMRYGKQFQLHRRIFQQHFNKVKSKAYTVIQSAEARILAQGLLDDLVDKTDIVNRYATAIIMYITYGHRVTSNDDPFMVLADDVGGALALAGSLGAGLVDFFPILAYLPSWFPGTYFMNHARKWEPKLEEMLENPFQDLMKKLNQGSAKPCIVSSQLESLERNGGNSIISIGDIKGAARQAYFAGAETTSSVLTVFILAVILHPECQVKAQAELDAVVGPERLPEFGDRHSLPYLECLLHETLRWYSPLPSAIPHLAVDDDIYRGMFIPKGSLVIGNVRGMSWDEKVYANPFSFEPTRYLPAPLGRGEPHPTAHWGFGRRICPGRHLADSSVWIAMATLLSTLSISKALGEDGKEITPEINFLTSLTSRLKPFPFRTKPRSETASALLSQVDIIQDY